MVKILHEDIPAFSGQGIHGTIDFLVSTISFLVHLIKGLLADVYLLNNSGNNYVPSELNKRLPDVLTPNGDSIHS